MKKFVFLTYGFEKPTPEIMESWGKWFESIKDRIVEKGHFPRGREISHEGTRDLPLDMDAITGYCMIQAESFEEAEELAKDNPFIASIRVYEVMAG